MWELGTGLTSFIASHPEALALVAFFVILAYVALAPDVDINDVSEDYYSKKG